MPRLQNVLTAGFKLQVTPSFLNSQSSQKNLDVTTPGPPSSLYSAFSASLGSPLSAFYDTGATSTLTTEPGNSPPNRVGYSQPLKDEDDQPRQKGGEKSDFERNRDKRKSRLGTTTHLSQKMELSEHERKMIYKEGFLFWCHGAAHSKAIKSAKKSPLQDYYFVLRDGEIRGYTTEQHGRDDTKPKIIFNVANCRANMGNSHYRGGGKQLIVMLIEDNETHLLESGDLADLEDWRRKILSVSRKWGEVQRNNLEHEVAYMRKQLGALWEMGSKGAEVNVKVQKRIADVTNDIQNKDSLLADVADRQEEFEVSRDGERRKSIDDFDDAPPPDIMSPSTQMSFDFKDTASEGSMGMLSIEEEDYRLKKPIKLPDEEIDDNHSILESTYILMNASSQPVLGSKSVENSLPAIQLQMDEPLEAWPSTKPTKTVSLNASMVLETVSFTGSATPIERSPNGSMGGSDTDSLNDAGRKSRSTRRKSTMKDMERSLSISAKTKRFSSTKTAHHSLVVDVAPPSPHPAGPESPKPQDEAPLSARPKTLTRMNSLRSRTDSVGRKPTIMSDISRLRKEMGSSSPRTPSKEHSIPIPVVQEHSEPKVEEDPYSVLDDYDSGPALEVKQEILPGLKANPSISASESIQSDIASLPNSLYVESRTNSTHASILSGHELSLTSLNQRQHDSSIIEEDLEASHASKESGYKSSMKSEASAPSLAETAVIKEERASWQSAKPERGDDETVHVSALQSKNSSTSSSKSSLKGSEAAKALLTPTSPVPGVSFPQSQSITAAPIIPMGIPVPKATPLVMPPPPIYNAHSKESVAEPVDETLKSRSTSRRTSVEETMTDAPKPVSASRASSRISLNISGAPLLLRGMAIPPPPTESKRMSLGPNVSKPAISPYASKDSIAEESNRVSLTVPLSSDRRVSVIVNGILVPPPPLTPRDFVQESKRVSTLGSSKQSTARPPIETSMESVPIPSPSEKIADIVVTPLASARTVPVSSVPPPPKPRPSIPSLLVAPGALIQPLSANETPHSSVSIKVPIPPPLSAMASPHTSIPAPVLPTSVKVPIPASIISAASSAHTSMSAAPILPTSIKVALPMGIPPAPAPILSANPSAHNSVVAPVLPSSIKLPMTLPKAPSLPMAIPVVPILPGSFIDASKIRESLPQAPSLPVATRDSLPQAPSLPIATRDSLPQAPSLPMTIRDSLPQAPSLPMTIRGSLPQAPSFPRDSLPQASSLPPISAEVPEAAALETIVAPVIAIPDAAIVPTYDPVILIPEAAMVPTDDPVILIPEAAMVPTYDPVILIPDAAILSTDVVSVISIAESTMVPADDTVISIPVPSNDAVISISEAAMVPTDDPVILIPEAAIVPTDDPVISIPAAAMVPTDYDVTPIVFKEAATLPIVAPVELLSVLALSEAPIEVIAAPIIPTDPEAPALPIAIPITSSDILELPIAIPIIPIEQIEAPLPIAVNVLPTPQKLPASLPQAPLIPSALPKAPALPVALPMAPKLPIAFPQAPVLPIALPQAPTLPISLPQAPTLPISLHQAPTLPISLPKAPVIPVGLSQAPTRPISLPQAPVIPASLPQAPILPMTLPVAPSLPMTLPMAPTLPIALPMAPKMVSLPKAPTLVTLPNAPKLPMVPSLPQKVSPNP